MSRSETTSQEAPIPAGSTNHNANTGEPGAAQSTGHTTTRFKAGSRPAPGNPDSPTAWQEEALAGRKLAASIQRAFDQEEWGDDFEAEVKAALDEFRQATWNGHDA